MSEFGYEVEAFPFTFVCPSCGKTSIRKGRCRKCKTKFEGVDKTPTRNNEGSWWDKHSEERRLRANGRIK